MPRPLVFAVLVVAALVGAVALGRSAGTAAQDATPDAAAGHPLVGAWLADTDADDPANPPSLIVFHGDGTYLQTDPDGSNGVGTWEATGARTAALTAIFHAAEEGAEGVFTVTVRATVEVDEAGDGWVAGYTLEFVGPDGASQGEVGPGTAVGERIAVEPMGTPTASMEEAFAEPAATPAA